MEKYDLTEKAKEDLFNIWQYTINTWSETQADNYYSKIIAVFEHLSNNPMYSGSNYDQIYQGLRGYFVGKHIVFHLKQANGRVLIVRILHVSMDYKQHLQ